MCDCNRLNVLSSPQFKIYTAMAKYEVKKEYQGRSSSVGGMGTVIWDEASQELLSHLYEERGFITIITKVSDEKSTSKKKDSKNESKASDKE